MTIWDFFFLKWFFSSREVGVFSCLSTPYPCGQKSCGVKEFGNSDPLYTKPKAHVERKKCPRTNEESLNCLETSPRTILFLANPNPRREERHAIEGSLPEHPRKKDKYSRTVRGAWCRSNSRRNCHLRIKCPQLTFRPH